MFCNRCGRKNEEDARFCCGCGAPLPTGSENGGPSAPRSGSAPEGSSGARRPRQTPTGDIGLIGFVTALLALVFGWIPFLGPPMWLAGAMLSIAGLFKEPRGFAIAGTAVSFIGMVATSLLLSACSAYLLLN